MRPAFDEIPLFAAGGYNVVVETPRGNRTKFAWDAETGMFRAKKLLAMGFAFPFAFGFLPSTRAGDGDPSDVLLMTDAELPTGALVRCRLLGALTLEESRSGSEPIRNDRLLTVPLLLHQDRPPYDLFGLPGRRLATSNPSSSPIRRQTESRWSLVGVWERKTPRL